jgi:4-amino-4-deoxy-L-arabinose transferase-like glycosyltransferase
MRARHYALLVLACLALFLPGLAALPPLDRDEPRFAQASRQMLESGDFVDIRFQDEERLKKPVGIYWLQSASAALFGDIEAPRIWPYRLPSTLGATLAVLLTAAIGARLFGAAAGTAAALMLATSLLLGLEARLAKTDAVQLAAVCAAQLALAEAYLARHSRKPPGRAGPALFWGALGLGILVKGPIILMVCGLTAAGLSLSDRSARWLARLRPWPWALLALLIVAPWGAAIMLQTKGAFLSEAVGHDLLGKVAGAQESHGAPPGFFLVTFWATFWPFSLLAVMALPWVWRHRRHPAVRFCLAWIVPSWLVFELVPTKLPHYTLPLLPAVALLAACAAQRRFVAPATRLGRVARAAAIAGWLGLSLALCAGLPLLPALLEHRIDPVAIAAGLAVLLLVLAALRLQASDRRPVAFASLGLAGLILYVGAYERVMPGLQSLWIAPRVAAAVRSDRPCRDTAVMAAGFSEPSLVFMLGTRTRFGSGAAAAEALLEDSCALALVDRRELAGFAARLREAGKAARPLATIDGINPARGRAIDLTLFGKLHPEAAP